MSMNFTTKYEPVKTPLFVKEMDTPDNKPSYVNVNDLVNIRQTADNYWEAESMHGMNKFGGKAVYHFDNAGAKQILNRLA